MSLIEYNLALHYALETYNRRDIMFIMSKIYGKKGGDKGDINLTIPQTEIEDWVKKQYEDDI